MYLRIGSKILNTETMTDADVYEPGEKLLPHDDGRVDTLTVAVTTTAVETSEDGTLGARRVWLGGEEANLFLEALPVYAPVLERA